MKKWLLLPFLCFPMGFTFQAQALDMSPVMQHFKTLTRNSTQRYTLALLPIARFDKKESDALTRYVNDHVLQGLIQNRGFTLVERENMQAILKEQGFSQSAYVTPDEAVAVGQLLGARLLLAGHYMPLNEHLHFHLKLIDAQSGKILTVIQEKVAKDSLALELAPNDREVKAAEAKKAKEAEDWKNFINGAVTLGEAGIKLNNALNGETPLSLPTQAPVFRPPSGQRVFYEDFSRFAPGTPMNSFGKGMVVRQSQRYGMNIVTTESPFTPALLHRVNLPRNFALEIHAFDRLTNPTRVSANPLQVKLWSRDRSRVLELNKYGHRFVLGPQSVAAPWRYQDWNVIALVKRGRNVKAYINGQEVLSASITDMPWQGFELTSPQLNHWAFTRFSVQAL